MFCPKCGTENRDSARFCKHCGQPLPKASPPRKLPWLIGALVLAVVCVVSGVVIYPRLKPARSKPLYMAETATVVEETFEAATGADWDTGIGLIVSIPPASTEGKVELVVKRSVPEQREEEFIALHSVYDISLSSAGTPQEHPLITLTFEIPEGIDPHSAVVLQWTEKGWIPAESKGELPGGEVSSDGRHIFIVREQLSRYAIAEWLYKYILRYFERLPEPPPPSPVIDVKEATPDHLGHLVVEVALESPTAVSLDLPIIGHLDLGGMWYRVKVEGDDHLWVRGPNSLAPGEKQDLQIIFPSTGGQATLCLSTEGTLPRAAWNWAARLGLPKEEIETVIGGVEFLLEVYEHLPEGGRDWKDLVWAAKKWLMGLFWKAVGWEAKFRINMVPVSIDIATYINARTDYRADPCVDVPARATTPTLTPSPEPGPQSKIAFASDRDGDLEIYVMNADGMGLVRLTENSVPDWCPAWSPDGGRIAFTSGDEFEEEIYAMNADGSGVVRLTESYSHDSHPNWSPDRTKIAFESDRGKSGELNFEIYVMNADGTEQVNLSRTPFPAEDVLPSWSPDGRRIAFATDRDGNWEIYLMNGDGTGQIRLTRNSADDVCPAWSPDGKRIAFASNRDGDNEIYLMNADGTGVKQLTENTAEDLYPSWSPNGKQIAFECDRDGDFEIYVMNADGSGLVNVTNNPANDRMPAWASGPTSILPPTPTASPPSTGLPREIERIVFEESDFAEPITVRLAGGDDPGVYQEYQTQILDHLPAPVHLGWASASGAGWLDFLVKNGYAEAKTVRAQACIGPAMESKFLFYNEEAIRPYILSGSCEPDSYFTLLLARRKLRGIGFTNEYEQLGEKFYAVNFTYILEEALPGLPEVRKEFEGKAILWWDPSEGTWTLDLWEALELEDHDRFEYQTLLSEIYGK